PVVDVQNVARQTVITREIIERLPTGKGISAFATLIPGMVNSNVQDVGGSSGDYFVSNAVHGGRSGDQRLAYDGMRSNNIHGGGGGGGYSIYVNPESVQEIG